MNVSMNSLAVDLVTELDRPIMPSFHAAWSFGGLAGASLGGLLAPHLTPLPHLALVGLAGLAVTAVAGRTLLAHPVPPAQARPGEDAAPLGAEGLGARRGWARRGWARRWRAPGGHCRRASRLPEGPSHLPGGHGRVWRVVLLFGLIALCSAYGEGAIGDWGALHLREDLGAGAGLAAAGYAAFALAEASGRLAGSWLLATLGQTRVLVLGGLIACAGMLAAALAPAIPVALIGFALTGLGVANMFPAAMTRAGLAAGPNGVALASTLGYAGFLLGPPAIGFLASSASLGTGLTTVSALALVAAVLAWVSGRAGRGPGRAAPPAR